MIFNQGSTKATEPSFSIWEKVVGLIWTTPALVSNMAMITAIDVFASVLPRTCPNTAHQAMVPHTLVTTTVRNKAQTMQTQPRIVFQFINFFSSNAKSQKDPTPSCYDKILNANFRDLYVFLYDF